MKNLYLVVLACVVTSCLFFSCNPNNNEITTTYENSNNKTNKPQNLISDLIGVWQGVNNQLLFLSVSPSGKVSFCLDYLVMGYGTAKYISDTLIINDDYLGCTDKIEITKNNNYLYVHGKINKHKSNEQNILHIRLENTDEAHVLSFAGDYRQSSLSLGGPDDASDRLSIIGDNIADYKKYNRSTIKLWWEDIIKYIPRIVKTKNHDNGPIHQEKYIYCTFSTQDSPNISVYRYGMLRYNLDVDSYKFTN